MTIHSQQRPRCCAPTCRAQVEALSVLVFLSLTIPAFADNDIHGRLELQDVGAFARADSLAAAFDSRDRNDLAGNLRLTWEPSWDNWNIAFHYVALADYGDGARLQRLEGALLPQPPSTWLNLFDTFEDHGSIIASHGIDRLSVAYSTPSFVVRVGRQALTWGGGYVFRPMDLFDPFAPSATDTEFKPGTDMIYAQWLFQDGSDLQAIAVPRPSVKGALPATNASSFALHYRRAVGAIQATVLVARDHGDWTGALQLSGPLAGASWDVELVPVFVNHGPARLSAIANISAAVTLFARNATLFAEYFHNGFGVTDGDATFATLPPALLDRLARGELFNVRQNYLAAGLTLEWTPLLTLSPTLIAGLDDASLYALFAANYSLSDNLVLIAGAQAPLGSKGTEFGGLPATLANSTTLGPSPVLYLQIRQYF